jgi:hypothetical protein
MNNYEQAMEKTKALQAEMQGEIDAINVGQSDRLIKLLSGVLPGIEALSKEADELGPNRPPIANNIVNIREQIRATIGYAETIVGAAKAPNDAAPVS